MSLVARDGKNNLSPFDGHSGRAEEGEKELFEKNKLFSPLSSSNQHFYFKIYIKLGLRGF